MRSSSGVGFFRGMKKGPGKCRSIMDVSTMFFQGRPFIFFFLFTCHLVVFLPLVAPLRIEKGGERREGYVRCRERETFMRIFLSP